MPFCKVGGLVRNTFKKMVKIDAAETELPTLPGLWSSFKNLAPPTKFLSIIFRQTPTACHTVCYSCLSCVVIVVLRALKVSKLNPLVKLYHKKNGTFFALTGTKMLVITSGRNKREILSVVVTINKDKITRS